MRSMFLLYGSPGQLERLQQEIAVERKRQSDILKEQIKKQKFRRNLIIGSIAAILGLGIIAIEIYILTNHI